VEQVRLGAPGPARDDGVGARPLGGRGGGGALAGGVRSPEREPEDGEDERQRDADPEAQPERREHRACARGAAGRAARALGGLHRFGDLLRAGSQRPARCAQASAAPVPGQPSNSLRGLDLQRFGSFSSLARVKAPPDVRAALGLALVLGLLLALGAVTAAPRRPRADLVIDNGTDVRTLDPAGGTGLAEGRVLRALFEGLLVKHPATLEPLPGVAAWWEASEDGLRWVFRLRPDACWIEPGTDPARFDRCGPPVTAEDFVVAWRRLLDPRTGAPFAGQLACVVGARAFTALRSGVRFGSGVSDGLWFEELEDGGVRAGATAFGPLEGTSPARPELAALAAGEAVDAAALLAGARERGELLGEDEYRERAFAACVGIRALDPRTLEVELERPTPWFLDLVSSFPLLPVSAAALREARERWPATWPVEWLRPEHLVTNGPFRLVERRIQDRLRLVKSPVYWDADAVGIDSIDVLSVEHAATSLNLFLGGEVDWIDRAPPDLVPLLIERGDLVPAPYLGTYFYRVNVTRPPLDDRRVRRALALAIDRRAISAGITKKGEEPCFGLVPPGLDGYERARLARAPAPPGADEAARFSADVALARELLGEAGFGPGGAPPPEIEIHYNASDLHRDVAEVVADGWRRHLGIEARLASQETSVFYDTQNALDYDVSRSSWIADYRDAETFLSVFAGGGENNRTGWSDPRYDELLARASREVDPARRLALLHDAEARLLEELPILPLFAYTTQNLVSPRLDGFWPNALDEHFPKFFRWRAAEAGAR